ncbi:hypothetical protein ABZ330_20440 [Streptomyces sp. NPDC006172]|uniref:hypothetical protein n=1 Tax=Streptomyces sp. NPDC006172 TaxID=3154470 RepID=UPI0033D6E120
MRPSRDGSDAVVSAFVVHRVNQLPVETLDLSLPRTSEFLRRETACAQRLADQAGPLSDALHAAVPQLEDAPHLRRAALHLRRQVHNGRPAHVPDDVVQDLRARLGAADGAALAQWLEGMLELTALRARTDALYDEETAAATNRLRGVLSVPVLAQGLAQANPQLLSNLTVKPLEPHSKAARAVLGYVSRAAVKTSPFSRLTALALDGQDMKAGTSHSYVDQQHVHAWLNTLARDERYIAALEVEPNRSVRRVAGRPFVLTPSYGGPGDSAWRMDSLADASRYSAVLEELATWSRMTIAEALVRIGGSDPFGGFLRLLDTGLLRLVLPWSPTEQRPLRALAVRLKPLPSPAAERTRLLLERLDAEATGLHLLSGPERARSVGESLARIRAVPDGDPRPSSRYAVYEDALSDIPLRLPTGPIEEDLAALGRLIRPYIFRSHLYDWLRDEFVTRYGPGGHCPDLFEFLWAVAASPGFDGKLYRALLQDHAESGRPSDRAWLPVSAGSAPPTTAVLYQIAARSVDDIRRGDHRLVVNQYNSGVGGLVARFRHLLDRSAPAGAGLTHHLRAWIAELFPHAVPHQVTLSGDVNGMHHVADGILPPLHWPGEPPSAAEAPRPPVTASVRHCQATDTLEFLNPEGLVLAPVYLGVVPQHLVPGVARLLLCLADPWVNGSRLCCTANPVDAAPPPVGADIQPTPRRSHNRLVLGRRTWRFPPELLPTPAKGETQPAFFRRVHEWRTGHTLPDEVFLSVEASGPPSAVSSHTKPLWLSFRSPHALWAAAHHVGKAKDVKAVRLAEACPDRSAYWLRDDEGRHRAAEHVSLLRWERPNTKAHLADETTARITEADA